MHGGIYTAARLANQSLAFLLLPLYARRLGSEGLGIVEVTNAARNVLSIVFLQGLAAAWFRLRLGKKDPGALRSFEASVVWYLIGSCAVLMGLLLWVGDGVAHWATPGVPFRPYGVLTMITAAALGLPTLLERKLQADQTPLQFAVFSVLRTSFTLAAIVWFVVGLQRGALGKVEAEAIVTVLSAACALIWIRPASPGEVRVPELRSALAYGWPQIPHGLAAFVNDMIDRIFISAALGLAAVGVYSVGYRVATVPLLLMTSVNQAFSPLFIEALHDAEQKTSSGDSAGAAQVRASVAASGLAVVVLGATLGLMVAAAGRELIALIAPVQAEGAWPVLGPVAFGVVAWSCYAVFSQSIVYNVRSARLLPVVGISGAASNVVGNLLLVPRLGIMGAAWATCLSYTVFALFAWRIGMRCTPVAYAWGRWLRVLSWTALSLCALHACDAAAWPVLLRVTAKAACLACSLGVIAWLSGLTPARLRRLRASLSH